MPDRELLKKLKLLFFPVSFLRPPLPTTRPTNDTSEIPRAVAPIKVVALKAKRDPLKRDRHLLPEEVAVVVCSAASGYERTEKSIEVRGSCRVGRAVEKHRALEKEKDQGKRKNPPEEFNAWMKPYHPGRGDTYFCVYTDIRIPIFLYNVK